MSWILNINNINIRRRFTKKNVIAIFVLLWGPVATGQTFDNTSEIAYPPDSDLVTKAEQNKLAKVSSSDKSSLPSLIVDPMVYDEPYDTGWQLYVDNDLFVSSDTDRDYTGGIAVALTGRRAREWWFSMDSWLDSVDQFTGIQSLQMAEGGFSRHALEIGFTLFTPENITIAEPIFNDRPYASFLFMANSQQITFPEQRWVLQSALTIGFLGLKAGPEFQSLIHDATGSTAPTGWDNQISDGGELTGKYSVIAQKNLIQRYNKFSFELSAGAEGNIGLNTDASVSMGMRFGQLKSPWWSFMPHQSDYINLGQTMTSRIDERIMPAEFFGWAGIKAKYQIYNGLLQGQFRDSVVEFEGDQLEDVIYEAWIGATKTWSNGFGLSFVVRGRTNEIKGPNGRDPIWSGFILSFKN